MSKMITINYYDEDGKEQSVEIPEDAATTLVSEAVNRAFNHVRPHYYTMDIDDSSIDESHFQMFMSHTSYDRCGDSSTTNAVYTFPMEALLSDEAFEQWEVEDEERRAKAAEEARRKAAIKIEEDRLRREKAQYDRDVADFERLKAKLKK